MFYNLLGVFYPDFNNTALELPYEVRKSRHIIFKTQRTTTSEVNTTFGAGFSSSVDEEQSSSPGICRVVRMQRNR
jgi:hypothetical protein